MHPILTGFFLLAVTSHTTPPAHSAARHPHTVTANNSWADVHRRLSAQDAEIALLRRLIARQDAEIAQIRRQIGQKVAAVPPAAPHTRQLALPATTVYDLVLSSAYPQALGAATDILTRDSDNAEAEALKAISCIKMGQTDAGRTAAAAALNLTEGQQQGRPRALALIAQGLVYEADNDKTDAIKSYQSAGNMDEMLGLTYIVYADLFHRTGRDDLAKRLLQTGLTQKTTPEENSAIQTNLDKM